MADAATYTTIGAILAVAASIFNAIGYTVQKQGHTRLKEYNKDKEQHEKKRLIKEKVWAAGFGIYLIGGVLNAVSLFYAPQSLVLPLSATTLVANTILATKVLNEPFFRADIAGIVFVILGSVLAVIFGPRTAGGEATMNQLKDRWGDYGYMVFFLILSGSVTADYLTVRLYERKNARDISVKDELKHGATFLLISYCALAGYFGSLAFLFLKSFTEFIGSSARSSAVAADNAANWYSYFTLIGVVVTNLLLEFFRQRGLSYFHAVYVVPINQVILIVMGTVLGGLYFQEFENMTAVDAVLFTLAILLTVIGVFILAFNSGNVSEKSDAIINQTITLSMDPNPHMHPLPVPKIITTSPSMPITRRLNHTIPDLPPPGMAGTIARIHGLQRSMATLQYTQDGKPFYQDEHFDTLHLQKVSTTLGLDKIDDKLGISTGLSNSISKLQTFQIGRESERGQGNLFNKLRRGISLPELRETGTTDKEPALHKQSSSAQMNNRNGQELVSSHSERGHRVSDLFHGDEFRRPPPSSSNTGVQPDFVNIRQGSPSYTDKPLKPENGQQNGNYEMEKIDHGDNEVLNLSAINPNGSSDLDQNSVNIRRDNHALEIEMEMDDSSQDPIPSPIDRTNSEQEKTLQPPSGLSDAEKQQTI